MTDTYTTSPRIRPADAHRAPPVRTASVSERIANRLREIQKRSAGALSASTTSASIASEDGAAEEKPPQTPTKVDKGKGKEVLDPIVSSSPPPMSPLLPPTQLEGRVSPMPPFPAPPILLAGLSLPPAAVSQLLTKAASDLNLRPVRVPLFGEYQDCFNGEEFVAWLNENVDGFGGSLDRAEDAAKELTEREGLLRRIGEFGNQFEHSDDAFYQFRPKVTHTFLWFPLEIDHTSRLSISKARMRTAFHRQSKLCNRRTCSNAPTTLSILSVRLSMHRRMAKCRMSRLGTRLKRPTRRIDLPSASSIGSAWVWRNDWKIP